MLGTCLKGDIGNHPLSPSLPPRKKAALLHLMLFYLTKGPKARKPTGCELRHLKLSSINQSWASHYVAVSNGKEMHLQMCMCFTDFSLRVGENLFSPLNSLSES